MVNIESVTAEIFLIWTNDARTNVVWKNVTVTIGIYLYSLAKIEFVTAEIFLIWTNDAKTNVVLTNVTVTVDICSRCSKEL